VNTIDKLFNELVEQAAAAAEKRVLEQLENMITPDKVTDNRSVIRCEYCGSPLKKIGRRKFCDNACKQAAYRERHNKKG